MIRLWFSPKCSLKVLFTMYKSIVSLDIHCLVYAFICYYFPAVGLVINYTTKHLSSSPSLLEAMSMIVVLDSIPSNNHCYYKNEYPIHSSFICQCTWKMEKKLFFLCFCYDFNKFTQACETECNVYTIYAFAIILSCLIFL